MVRIAVVLVPVIVALVALYHWRKSDEFDPHSIRDKRVLITGASSGIGEQLAYQYARLGARLVITARRAHLLQGVAQKCSELGAQQVESVPADMAIPKDRIEVIKRTANLLGGLDHLILNHADFRFAFWNGTSEDIAALHSRMNVNFFSYVDLASQALEMLTTSRGKIGIVSSVIGKIGQVMATNYASSKFALQGFFTTLRQELKVRATGVSVTLCVLSLVDTDAALEQINRDFPDLDTSIAGSSIEAAAAIVQGVTTAALEIYYPTLAYILVTVHSFVPGFIEDYFTTSSSNSLRKLLEAGH